MKKLSLALMIFLSSFSAYAQMHTDQNGLKTTVTNVLSTQSLQAKQFEIATIGYNSYHWQMGGTVIIELFDTYFSAGYEKYIIEVGFGQGINTGVPAVNLVSSTGAYHNARIVLGTPYPTGTSYVEYPNYAVPVYIDVREYSRYRARITYMQDRTDNVPYMNQINIRENPEGINIDDFIVGVPNMDLVSGGALKVTGNGTHYIQNGNVGIGTTSPDAKLSVKGKIHAEEVRVDLNVPGPDYVFADDYKLLSLEEIDSYIKTHKHLPDILSAKEMKEYGINMSEMQMKLPQKIEELTLHVIAQEKTIQQQSLALDKMQAELLKISPPAK